MILIGLGGAAGAVALVLLLVVLLGGDDGGDDVASGGSTSSTAASTTTTQPVDPVTTAPTSSSTTSTTVAPTTAPPATAAPSPPLSAQGAVLQLPGASPPRTFDEGVGCASLADRGPWSTECGTVTAGGVDLAWMVAEHDGTDELRAYLFRRLVGNQWTIALSAVDEARDFAGVVVRAADVSGDGQPEVVYGFRHQGTGQILELDVVEAPGRVVVHRELDKGTAVAAEGRLEDWTAQFGPDDPNCCPSSFLYSVIRFDGSAWRVVEKRQVAPDQQPPGDF
jgi:hypothetical protein